VENVEPILKIMHPPTVQRQILKNTQCQQTLGASTECLISAICYAAVATMTVEDCRLELNEDKHEILKRYVSGLIWFGKKKVAILIIFQDIAPDLKAHLQRLIY
jgi:hypothetical protein